MIRGNQDWCGRCKPLVTVLRRAVWVDLPIAFVVVCLGLTARGRQYDDRRLLVDVRLGQLGSVDCQLGVQRGGFDVRLRS